MKKYIYAALAICLLPVAAAGCAEVEPEGAFITGDVAGGEAETLNWILAADASSFGYVGYTLESLATYDNDFNIQLRCLARDIEVSGDGLVYIVTIRDDLKWSDGSQVTAEDYVYTLQNLMFSDWLNYNYKDDWQEEAEGNMVFVKPEVVNDTEFTVTRQSVQPEFIYTLYDLIPYPAYIAKKYEGDIDAFTQASEFNDLSYTGNLGPYKFKQWLKNDKFVLERNPEFFLGQQNGAPFFEECVIKMFGTSAVMQAALESGDITYCGLEPANVSRFMNMPQIDVYTVPTRGYNLISYNQRDNGWEGLRKKEVRQAISMAIDKDVIAQKIYLGFAEPAYSFIPSSSPWYSGDTVLKLGVAPLNDKQLAIQKLKDCGYEYAEIDGKITLLGVDGEPVRLSLVTTPGSDVVESMSLLIKQELEQIGIEVEVKWVQWPTLLRQYMMNKLPGGEQEPRYNNGPNAVSEEAWDLTLMGHNTDPMAPSGSSVFFASDGGLNSFGFFNEEVDRLFESIKSEEGLDKQNRENLYKELARLVSEEQPVDFVVYTRSNRGFQGNVRGIEPGINMGYNYYLWHFE